MKARVPFLLGLYYFALFAAAGIYVPYLGIYSRGLGFTSLQVGLLAALTPLSKILFPPVWGALADRSGHRRSFILLTTALSIAAFSALFKAETFLPVAFALLAYSFFHAPILALSETLTLEEAARGGFAYGRVRAWGSVGYMLATLVLGALLDLTSMRTFVIAFVAASSLQLASALALPAGSAPAARHAARGVWDQLRRSDVLLFLLACTLMEVSHSAYIGFFGIHLSESGVSKKAIGVMLALPQFSEIPAMYFADRWLQRAGGRRLMLLAFAAAALRWLVLGITTDLVVVALSQGLHALTYGVFHITAVQMARRLFPAHLQASAQSLYIGLTYGLGGTLGLIAAGRLYDPLGAQVLFLLSAAVAIAALPAILRLNDSRAIHPQPESA
ncbi:MAG TPA: MFS transporter [Candidatus Polarisedimenticolia bacterium]|nr:MFS transporter [Candidatus Polarisedimenticolia bacterium]